MTLAAGTKLGPYEISELLGTGGMGVVYRAHDARLNRDVALKMLTPELSANPLAVARFAREAKSAAALSHPNIVAIYDVGTWQERPYLVMELLRGESLRTRLRQGALVWREAVRVGAAIANGLAAAHAVDMVHRDLKPENVFLTQDGQVKILDFGLARIREPESTLSAAAVDLRAPTMQAFTHPGTVLGTPGYMAPEQALGEEATAAADLFAFGCLLFEMLAGKPLFLRPTVAETLAATLRDSPPALCQTSSDTPPQLEQLLAQCLVKAAPQRLQSAQTIASELQCLLSGASQQSDANKFSPDQPLWVHLSRRAWLGLAASSLALGGGWGWYHYLRRSTYDSLAVLPINNQSGDSELDALCDGLTETLINKFSQLPQLRVIARTTAFEYKNQLLDLQKLRRELDVDAVLTGKLTRAGEMFVVQVDLVDVTQRTQLWGDRYFRSQTDVFNPQDEIAREIAGKLLPQLTASQTERLVKRDTNNATANDLYFKGLSALNQRELKGIRLSIGYFEQALNADPNLALAKVGLARAYILAEGWIAQEQARENARTYALAALELDPTLADAHTSLAVVKMLRDWKFKEAEQSFKSAIELSPNGANSYHWYAEYLTAMARHDDAIAAINRAKDLDPLSVPINRDMAWHFYCARQYDKALEQCQLTLTMDPNRPNARALYGRILLQMGQITAALKELQQVADLRQAKNGEPGNRILAELSYAHALAGNQTEARRLITQLTSKLDEKTQLPLVIVATYVLLGNIDEAFAVLERALKHRDEGLVYLKVQPPLAPLSSNWRFIQLLKRIGLLD